MKIKTLKLCCALSISLMLAACGGGKDNKSALDNYKTIIKGSSSSNSGANAVGADTLQAIEFDTALPATLTLKGTGGAESSRVTFRVVGKTGLALKGVTVNFMLNSEVGELKLSQASNISDDKGIVFTSVISGRVSTSVKVTATANSDPSISAQSSLLVVATGLPDQKSMSIAIDHFNPAGWRYNGIEAKVSVLLADAYNNPVANDTAVSFTTEGGSIASKCTTTDGGCTAVWKSQSPKPARTSSDITPERILCLNLAANDPELYKCRAERAGRITVLATAIGNESFKDSDGTGIYDAKDTFATEVGGNCLANAPVSSHENSVGACDDLPEAYLDKNESGTREPDEYFLNFITDTSLDLVNSKGDYDNYTPNNGLYNGAFCQPKDEEAKLCSRNSITIRKQLVMVMSCDSPYTVDGALPRISLPPLNIFALADCNGNALPVGTTVTIGSADPFTLGSEINWKAISAAPGTDVKLEIPIGDSSDAAINVMTYPTAP